MPKIRSFLRTQGKGLFLLFTMFLGGLFPQAHTFSYLIQYLLMVILLFAFLDIEFRPQTFQKSVVWILLASVALAFISYALLASFGVTLALAGFMTAIAPTAIAAPVVIWVTLTFINPLVTIGPMFYILYHHLYNSWLIYRFEKGRAA